MHPDKGIHGSLRNQVDQQTLKITKLKDDNTKLQKENAKLKAKKKRNWIRLKRHMKHAPGLFIKTIFYLPLIGVGIYSIIWVVEPSSKMLTYEGKIISIKTIARKTDKSNYLNCQTKIKNNKIQYSNCKRIDKKNYLLDYIVSIKFLNIDGKIEEVEFDERQGNRWGFFKTSPIHFIDHTNKLPFPKEDRDHQLYRGVATPYLGCMVKIFELRGEILNSKTRTEFVADVSMCAKKTAK